MKILKNALLLVILSFWSTLMIAQDETKQKYIDLGLKSDTLMYDRLYQGDVKGGLEACLEKIDFFRKGESWTNYLQALNDKAYLYHQMDSLDQLKESVFENLQMAERYLESSNSEWVRAKEQINSYYYAIGDYKNARDIINEVIPIKEANNASREELSTTYFNLGAAYNRLRDTDNALAAFKQSIKVKYEGKKLGWGAGEKLNNIGRVYKSRGELDSALHYLQTSEMLFDTLDLNGRHKRYKRWKVEGYILLAEAWIEKMDFKEVNHYLNLVGNIKPTNKENVKLHELRSDYFFELGDFSASAKVLLEAMKISKETKARYSPPLRARRLLKLSEILETQGDFETALEKLQEGINLLSPSFKDSKISSNPEASSFFAKPDALKLLKAKASILRAKYQKSDDINDLINSYATYKSACNLIRDIRQSIKSSDSRNDLSGNAIEVYEEAISVAHDMYLEKSDESYISEAFQLAESNKAQLLLESLNEQEARGYEGIPDTLATKIDDLRLYLATLQDRVVRSGSNSTYDDLIFKTKQELELYNSILEKSFPRYFQLKYDNNAITTAQVQTSLLEEDEALIEYFVGEKSIYVFLIEKANIDMVEIPRTPALLNDVNAFRNLLKLRPGGRSATDELNDFVNASRLVFNSLFDPILADVSEDVKSIRIIPDDFINSVPFDVLLMEDTGGGKGFGLDAQSYLLEEYDINYNYSATLLNKIVTKESVDFESNFIGYAPSFDVDDHLETRAPAFANLGELKCSKEEVNAILNLIGGTKRTGGKANKDKFLNEAKKYKVLHLATHAYADPNDSKFNKIFLQDDFLSDVNIYNLELNTELAVLSACNTGSGEILKGEGVMNLARGFMHAGCSSTLMSLWSVDDCATSELMQLFYQGLDQGLKKDEALRRAKIQYLEGANKTKLHPYYWAAFVPFGDMSSLDFEETWLFNAAISTGIALVLILLFFFFFRRK